MSQLSVKILLFDNCNDVDNKWINKILKLFSKIIFEHREHNFSVLEKPFLLSEFNAFYIFLE